MNTNWLLIFISGIILGSFAADMSGAIRISTASKACEAKGGVPVVHNFIVVCAKLEVIK